MPKMKTKRSLAKRVKVTGRGKLKRYKSGHSHLLESKSKPRKRKLRQSTIIEGRNERRMKRLLPKVGRSK
ncbi:50S ribosomal protein L35 [candidate division WOR-3 bacterium]|nr:50S ribosomal protein L35 [candidate division WOR-3 bacterium]MCK4334742.1 50S ribosomal protein L35 [candidate division WOR-3 bacterium]